MIFLCEIFIFFNKVKLILDIGVMFIVSSSYINIGENEIKIEL